MREGIFACGLHAAWTGVGGVVKEKSLLEFGSTSWGRVFSHVAYMRHEQVSRRVECRVDFRVELRDGSGRVESGLGSRVHKFCMRSTSSHIVSSKKNNKRFHAKSVSSSIDFRISLQLWSYVAVGFKQKKQKAVSCKVRKFSDFRISLQLRSYVASQMVSNKKTKSGFKQSEMN